MKKYIKPNTEVMDVMLEQMMAASSFSVNTETVTASEVLSREDFWDAE